MSDQNVKQTPECDERPADSALSASPGYSLLYLLAEIRDAVGDPKGKLMQDELVVHIRKIVAAGDEMRRIINIPGSTDFEAWATDAEINEAIREWDNLLFYKQRRRTYENRNR